MDKQQLLKNLEQDIYCRIKNSGVHGVGVFAIRAIPAGTNPFKGCQDYEEITFTRGELAHLHPEVLKMIYDFLPYEGDLVHIPNIGLNSIDISFFVNHSDNPNLRVLDNADFETIRDIKAGEELTSNYHTFREVLYFDKKTAK